MTESESQQVRAARWKFVALTALFLAPVIIATTWYFLADYARPAADPAGTLIEPVEPLEPFRAQRLDGLAVDQAVVEGQWTLIHVVDSPCFGDCRERLHYTRQIRDALGHERDRVERLAVVPNQVDAVGVAALLPSHPDLGVLIGVDGLVRQLPAEREPATVFLVDPLGNLMMRFDGDVEPAEILDDLDQLLSVSRIG